MDITSFILDGVKAICLMLLGYICRILYELKGGDKMSSKKDKEEIYTALKGLETRILSIENLINQSQQVGQPQRQPTEEEILLQQREEINARLKRIGSTQL